MQAICEVMLVCNNLQYYPQYQLPTGYYFSMYQCGDEYKWERIQQAAEQYHSNMNIDLHSTEFENNSTALKERQLFVCNQMGTAIATATAWYNHTMYNINSGRIHWVAVHPGYQGIGIANAMCTQLMNIFIALKHEHAIVTTESFRIHPIGLYKKFGFEPVPRNNEEEKIWIEINHQLPFKKTP